ncbi:DUF4212 domain-containing protein [Pseudenhygromyxa sp. WMMC2535]|uniref:DUF4212 domain-containing protein n=1 Tax=Pseudenhygromyxa sp. WMMC2535 TaxID=2712867 RepID=UPI001556E8FA|nr:DUF4212 domain-containing protein [Pseudenhygromyxa sp. WMMC2535]NVB40661.1 DUF4212 domain-containing protein [Pseudenhygromyxa sp. WMMC2535]
MSEQDKATQEELDSLVHTRETAYWQLNLRILGALLTVWFLVSYGAGIIFADALNQFSLAGFPLGFWFAQQGAIYVFVILIFIYVVVMNRIDRRFGVADD